MILILLGLIVMLGVGGLLISHTIDKHAKAIERLQNESKRHDSKLYANGTYGRGRE